MAHLPDTYHIIESKQAPFRGSQGILALADLGVRRHEPAGDIVSPADSDPLHGGRRRGQILHRELAEGREFPLCRQHKHRGPLVNGDDVPR
jgi:hypothetical protein